MNTNNTTYKDSPMGKIPGDWEVKKLGTLVEIVSGVSPSLFILNSEGEFPYLKVEDLNNCEKYQIESREYSNDKKNLVPANSVIFPKRGAAILNNKVRINSVIVQMDSNLMAIYPKSDQLNYEYLYYQITFEQLHKIADTSTIPQINNKHIIPYSFPLPPLPEQKAIAHILGLMDTAINKNNQLINKKELQKKWLMQNLLTGKKRLMGFSGEWKEFHLGSLGDTYTGLTGKSKEDFGTGKPYIPYLNIFFNAKIDTTNFNYVKITEQDKQNKASYGDIFFTVSSETPDEVGMASVLLDHFDELYLNSFCFGFRLYDFKTLVPEFSSYFLRADAFREEIYKLSQGATRFNLSKNNLMKLNVILPTPEEQIAIARVLQAADTEIQLLKNKTEKLREQKKGLMQVLLTGKKRIKCT